jgi:hypothetical protein
MQCTEEEFVNDERLQTKTKRYMLLSFTGLVVELEHLKIKTRLTNEKFTSVKGECEIYDSAFRILIDKVKAMKTYI